MYKAVFLDLDGTLLTDDKKISVENKEAIKYAKEKGALVVICSGRQQDMVKRYKDEIGASNYIICCNGSEIYDCDKKEEIFNLSVSSNLIYNFYEYARKK